MEGSEEVDATDGDDDGHPAAAEDSEDLNEAGDPGRPTSRSLASLARLARELLPGDSEFGDPLSTAGDETPQVLARRVAEIGNRRPSALREVGLGALQVYQAISSAYEPERGDRELAIMFTDLVGFSKWALKAGDEAALGLLRAVDSVQTPAITGGSGSVVKRLGDGMMAVFADPGAATRAALEVIELIGGIEVAGHTPEVRAGIHLGEPKRIGSDYVGVDVNIAARVADAAKGEEVLVTGPIRDRLNDAEGLEFKRKLLFRGKGTPTGLAVYSASPA